MWRLDSTACCLLIFLLHNRTWFHESFVLIIWRTDNNRWREVLLLFISFFSFFLNAPLVFEDNLSWHFPNIRRSAAPWECTYLCVWWGLSGWSDSSGLLEELWCDGADRNLRLIFCSCPSLWSLLASCNFYKIWNNCLHALKISPQLHTEGESRETTTIRPVLWRCLNYTVLHVCF